MFLMEETRMAGKTVKETIHAKGFDISVYTNDFENEFISLTDIARYKSEDANATICNWMRSRETLEFLGLWESLHNPDFKPLEFEGFRGEAEIFAEIIGRRYDGQMELYRHVCAKLFRKPIGQVRGEFFLID